MRGQYCGTVAKALLLVGGIVAKADAEGSDVAMVNMMRHLDTSSTTECATELTACSENGECVDCVESYLVLFDGCFDTLSGSTCDDLEGALCCAVDGCEDNEGLNNLLACANAGSACSVDIGDCAADGYSDSMTTSETECATELTACNENGECVDCVESYLVLFDGCFDTLSGSTCDDLEGAVCCAVDGCEDNEGLNDLLACINADSPCSFDIGDCAADGSRAIPGSDTTTDTDSPSYLSTPTTTSTTDTDYTIDATTSMTSETECATEVTACNADGECIECANSYAGLIEGCVNSASGSTCEDLEGAVCCAVDGCEDNVGLNDLLACVIVDSCSFDIGDCAADGSRAIPGSDTTTDTDSPSYLSTLTTASTTDTESTIDTTTDTDSPSYLSTPTTASTTDTESTIDTTTDTDSPMDLSTPTTTSTTDTDSPSDLSTSTTTSAIDADPTIDATTDTDSTAADDGEGTSSATLPVGDDDEDENDATDDASQNNAQSSATRSTAAKGGSAVVWLIAAAAPSLWRRFQ